MNLAPAMSIRSLVARSLRLLACVGLLTPAALVGQVVVGNGILTVAGSYGNGSFSGDGGLAVNAQLAEPLGLARDSAGNLYIADTNNFRIRKISTAGIITTVAGNGTKDYTGNGSGDGGPATSATLVGPVDVAVDASGNVFLADGNRIRRVAAATGIITTIAGGGMSSLGTGVSATSVALSGPRGVTVDSAGNVYIADSGTNVVRRVTVATGIVDTIAGNGTQGYTGDGGAPTSATLFSPSSVALDASGNLYIADLGNYVIREITGGKIVTAVGNGHSAISGDGGPALLASMECPSRVTFDNGNNLYISDNCFGDIREVTTATGIIQTVAGRKGSAGTTSESAPALDASLSFASTQAIPMSFDSSNRLFVATDSRVRVIAPLPQGGTPTNVGSTNYSDPMIFVTTAAETISLSVPAAIGGKQEYTVGAGNSNDCVFDGKTVNPAGTACSINVTFSPAYPGERYLPLQVVTSTGNVNFGLKSTGVGPLATVIPGTISTIAGTNNVSRGFSNFLDGPGGDGGPATSAKFNAITAMGVDGAGNIYIADYVSGDVRKVNILTGVITNVAGNDALQQGYSGDGGPASLAQMQFPSGVAVDSKGNIYIADEGNNVVRMVSATTGIITTIAGNGNRGDSGDGGPATSATLYYPRALAVDSADNLYIVDYPDNVVRKINATTGIISTVVGVSTGGNSGTYTGDGGPATSASLTTPVGIAIDAANNLYIADQNNRAIRKVTAATGIITTIAGMGPNVNGTGGDGGPGTSAQLAGPSGVAVDAAGNVYLSDFQVIRKVSAATGIITTVAGLRHNGYSAPAADGANALSAIMNDLEGLAIAPDGALLIAEAGDLIVRRVSVTGAPLVYPTATRVGAADSTDDPQTATLANIGTASLILSPPTTGQNPLLSSAWALENSATCPQLSTASAAYTLVAGASCGLPVDFKPTVAGTNTGTLVITDNSLNVAAATQTLSLTGTGIGGISISPTTITFPSTAVGATSAAMTATITNGGTGQLYLTTGTLTDATDFTQSNNCNGIVAPGASCTVTFTFTPKSAGTPTSTYSIADLNNSSSPVTVALSGPATAPPITATLSPATFTFTATTATAAATQTATLTNTGTTTLTIASITLGGNNPAAFTQSSNCGTTLAAGATCTITLGLANTSAGNFTALLTVADNATAGNQTATLSGTVTTVPVTATLTPSTFSFFSTTSFSAASQTATLTNTGTTALTIASISIGGANPTAFTQSNTCGATLAAGASCTITLGLVNTTVGTFAAGLTVADNATAGNQTATLAGTVAGVPQPALAPAMLTFAATNVGSTSAAQTLTLSNTGTASLGFSSISFFGTNTTSFAQTNSCPATLAVGASCAINVTCTPAAAGALSATLAANFPSPITQVFSALSCTGVAPTAPQAAFTPATAAFGTVTTGTASAAQTFTLTNAGTAALTITSISLTGSNAFNIAAKTCGTSLAAGASCTVTVTFAPTTTGALAATLSAVDAVGTQSSALTGTGSATPPDFSIVATPATQSTYRGTSVTYTVQLASLLAGNPYNSAVGLSAANLPSGATATFSSATVTPGAAPQSVAMTVTIPGLSAKTESRMPEGITFAAMLLGLACSRRTRRSLPRLLSVLLALGLGMAMTGCGSGNGFAIPSSTSVITVTATGPATSHSTTVTLTIQ